MISEKLTKLRTQRGWTQDQVAEKLEIKRARYNAWENGISKPDLENLEKISQLFSVSADYLISTNDEIDIPAWATPKDIRDLKKMLEEDTEIMFDGVPMDETKKMRVKDILTTLFWEAKEMNKETYGRKKTEK